MKLILTREVANLGIPGDIVEVKDGYGRNYLLPQGYAIAWSQGAEKQIASIKRAREVREIRDLQHANEIKAQLEALTIKLAAKAGSGGQLFGRITERDLVEAIKTAGGPVVDRRTVSLGSAVKSVGRHSAQIGIHPEVSATIDFEVVPA